MPYSRPGLTARGFAHRDSTLQCGSGRQVRPCLGGLRISSGIVYIWQISFSPPTSQVRQGIKGQVITICGTSYVGIVVNWAGPDFCL